MTLDQKETIFRATEVLDAFLMLHPNNKELEEIREDLRSIWHNSDYEERMEKEAQEKREIEMLLIEAHSRFDTNGKFVNVGMKPAIEKVLKNSMLSYKQVAILKNMLEPFKVVEDSLNGFYVKEC